MKKLNQLTDSINTSGLYYDTKQEQVPVTVTPEVQIPIVEVQVKEESAVIEQAVEEKVEPQKAFYIKEVEEDDVVPMSIINKASPLNKS